MSKLINGPTLPVIYSLPQEYLNNVTKLELLEKKITLGSNLIKEIGDQELISKLEKEKEEFEKQRKHLNTLIKKLEFISGSIKDFTLFFIFVRRLHKLAIEKLNFESNNKDISPKLIEKLKNEERDLYNEFVGGDCFSKVLEALSFESYQCYFQEYAKNFFDNIQASSDSYVSALLILKAMLYECSFFKVDSFSLDDVKFFLSMNMPHSVVLPDSNYELVALRCFFYYEIAKEYLKLKPVKNNLCNLKKSITLELDIMSYKSYNKEIFIVGLYDLEESLNKLEKKYFDFLKKKSRDNESEINESLVFFKLIAGEIQVINTKTKNLINDKYARLSKMRRLLAIIINENYLSNFLEIFNIKIGNDFLLNEIKKTEVMETNKEALNHLFIAICRDKFYTPLSPKIELFINEMIADYSKEDISVLASIEFEDLIEFSFYYFFILRYVEFNVFLNEVKNKLLYAEMVTYNRYINIKFDALEILEVRKNENINHFLSNNFKNKEEHHQHKKNILEEIKLNLEVMKDILHILHDAKTLEAALMPLVSCLVPMPEENTLTILHKKLENKQKKCQAEYQKIEKNNFFNKSKKITKKNEIHSKNNKQIEDSKVIESFFESLIALPEYLTDILKHMQSNVQIINQGGQKNSFSMDRFSLAINKCLSNINSWKSINETHNLSNSNFPELLEKTRKLIVENNLIKEIKRKNKLVSLQNLLNQCCLSMELLIKQVCILSDKYQNYNSESNKLLNRVSTSFEEDSSNYLFFSKSETKKLKIQNYQKLSKNYSYLSEQFYFLKKIINIIKCDNNEEFIRLCSLVIEAEEYQKNLKFFIENIQKKNDFCSKPKNIKKIRRAKSKGKNKTETVVKETTTCESKSLPTKNTVINTSDEKLIQLEAVITPLSSFLPSPSFEVEVETFEIINEIGNCLEYKNELSEENPSSLLSSLVTTVPEQSVNNAVTELEKWQKEFEIWKYEKNFSLLELFNIIENSTLEALRTRSNAFLKILLFHHQELIIKDADLTSLKYKIKNFSEVKAADLFSKYLVTSEQWLDETARRIISCMKRVENSFQNSKNSTEISPLALLTKYSKLIITFKNTSKFLIDAKKELSLLYSNFTTEVITEEKMSNFPELSKQIDKANQLKLDVHLIKQNIQEILGKLRSSAPDWFEYVNKIDPFYMENMEEKAANFEISSVNSEAAVLPVFQWAQPVTFYSMPVVYTVDAVQVMHTNILPDVITFSPP